MYENVYGKTSPIFGENAVTLPLDVDRPCLYYNDILMMEGGVPFIQLVLFGGAFSSGGTSGTYWGAFSTGDPIYLWKKKTFIKSPFSLIR